MNLTGRHFETGELVTLFLSNGRIERLQRGKIEGAFGGEDLWIAPGFCDMQVNGYAGFDFNIEAWGDAGEVTNDLPRLYEEVWKSGTALLCPTITTNSYEAICEAFRQLCDALRQSPNMANATPAFHLEGPYLADEDGPRGAHPREHVRDPDWDEFQRFQEAAEGRIRLVTLAPERKGSLPFIEKLTAAGVVVALGHTGAEPETIRDAVLAGARMSTHLGNAAHGMIRRHPNYIWEQLAHDALFASIIVDGHHLPPSVVKSFARAKGAERLILVSDVVALGGLPPKTYMEGRYEVLPSGKIVLANTPYLAGAGYLLNVCLANALRWSDLTLSQAVHSVTANPMRVLGLEGSKGHLRIGYDADITLFRIGLDGEVEAVATVVRGEMVAKARE